MKKLYYAYVVSNLKDYFEDKLREHGVIILSRDLVIYSNNYEPLYYYDVEVEEGIIHLYNIFIFVGLLF